MMPTDELLDALRESTRLLEEAIDTHIWMDDQSTTERKDCNYTNQVMFNHALLARAEATL